MLNETDITYLLRRTEFVARPARVAELMAKPSLADAVDDILAVPANPGAAALSGPDSSRVVQLTDFWFNRMAHDSPRPLQEKMALFWHGHFCSSNAKVGSINLMQQQIDLFRRDGLGNFRDLTITMSTQVAMLRYLDNNQNFWSSPNENFGRELMELFVLGVGNYTEADVQACARAWTGHTDTYNPGHPDHETYRWVPWDHDDDPKWLLGQSINNGGNTQLHGAETVQMMLSTGITPDGRLTRDVAAEFISRKLWAFFAGSSPSPAVVEHLRAAAIGGDFAIKPWLRALLTHPEFYAAPARTGLVRPPVDYVAATLVATGLRSEIGTPWWLLEGMGQRPLFPPDVSGWKNNANWINASAFGRRASTARHATYYVLANYWGDGGLIPLPNGTVTFEEVRATAASAVARRNIVTRLADSMQINLGALSRAALDEFAGNASWTELSDVVMLLLITP
ncbi:MAG TPA: DUF1800 domain-containing protein, partial [Ilumatobacter sp.]|nr:DUF1800 domain-containing protein [Ilumatobacter sp.]